MKNSLGFTLIELLVVISVIALLIAILLPVLSTARQGADTTRCLAGQQQIGVGLQSYAMDHQDRIPLSPAMPTHKGPLPVSPDLPSNQLFVSSSSPLGSQYTSHGLLLDDYLGVNEAVNCPTSSRPDLVASSLDNLSRLNQDAWSNYVYRNRFAASKDRIDSLGSNPLGEPATVLLFDFNQVDLQGLGMGADSLNHDGDVVNALYLDGHATSHRNDSGRFNLSMAETNPFSSIQSHFLALDQD